VTGFCDLRQKLSALFMMMGVKLNWLTAFDSKLTGTFSLSSALEGHMMHALCLYSQIKLDIFLVMWPTVLVLCAKHLAQVC
jgi:hypothetical protein